MNDYKVKGSSINSKIYFIKEKFSQSNAENLKNQFNDIISFPVLESSWYDYQVYIDILKKIAEMFYDSDIQKLKQVGVFSAKTVLNGVYKSFIQGKDFTKFLKKVSRLHSRFYSKGEMLVEISDNENKCEIILKGAPIYSEEDNYIAAGFYTGSAMACGLSEIICNIEPGNGFVRFILEWQ